MFKKPVFDVLLRWEMGGEKSDELVCWHQSSSVFYGLVRDFTFVDAQIDNNFGPYLMYNKRVLPYVKYGGRSPKFILGPMPRDVHSCTHWLRPRNSLPPRIWTRIRVRYECVRVLGPSIKFWRQLRCLNPIYRSSV
jgi:hypothetical protein